MSKVEKMQTSLMKLTKINEATFSKFFDLMIAIIKYQVDLALLSNEDFVDIDVGIGVIRFKLYNKTYAYDSFKPNTKLDCDYTMSLDSIALDTLIKNLTKRYKELL